MKKLKLPTPIPDSGPPEAAPPSVPEAKSGRGRRSKLPSVWRLLGRSIKEYAQDWKAYALVLIFVALPSNILSFFYSTPSASTQPTQSVVDAYITLGSVIMSVALLYSIAQKQKTGSLPGPRVAYYDGSVALVRFILVSLVLVLYLLPFLVGALIFVLGLQASTASSVYGPEQLIYDGIALLFFIPSVFLITRYGLSTVVCVADGLRPVASLRASRILTAGRFWAVLGRLAGLLLPAFGISLLAFFISYINFANIPLLLFQLLTTLIALPIGYLYLFNLYHELKASIQPEFYPTRESGQ